MSNKVASKRFSLFWLFVWMFITGIYVYLLITRTDFWWRVVDAVWLVVGTFQIVRFLRELRRTPNEN